MLFRLNARNNPLHRRCPTERPVAMLASVRRMSDALVHRGLAHAMERFILDHGLIEVMGRRSRELAEEKYDVRKINAVIMKTMGLSDEESI
jgi:hypothetical protein